MLMKVRWIVAIASLIVLLFVLRPMRQPHADIVAPGAATPISGNATARSSTPPDSPPPTLAAAPGGHPVPVDGDVAPSSPGTPAPVIADSPEAILEALENVQFALRDYRSVFGENPIGTNAEITKALTGSNLKQIKIPLPVGSSVNGEGEMCDRWDTPYFFHQISGKEMEVHSAGPDRVRGTADDVVAK